MKRQPSIVLAIFSSLFVLMANAGSSPDSGVQTKARHIAKRTGDAIEKGAQKAKEGVTKAAKHTGHALHTAAEKTESALQKTGEKIEGVVNK